MFQNYLKLAVRNLSKNRLFTVLNIAGLSLGMAAGLLMLLWTQDELSFDTFHPDAERIFRENAHFDSGGNEQTWSETPAPHALFALQEIPGVEKAVRIAQDWESPVFRYGDKSFVEKKGAYADSSFFEVFKTNMIAGNPARPFSGKSAVVVTETFARKYFGDADPLGKVFEIGKEKGEVSAVIRDLPGNSVFQFSYIRNFELLKSSYQPNDYWKTLESNWGDFNYSTFFKLSPGISTESVGRKLSEIHHVHNTLDSGSSYTLQPLTNLHLYQADGTAPGLQTVRILGLAGILLILIACINYMNLATARATTRAREVGMRKIIGAEKRQLFVQFLIESTVVFALAFVLAVVFARLLLPFCNEIADKKLAFDLTSPQTLLLFGGVMFSTLLISGIYPALALSSFQPLQVIKGNFLPRLGGVSIRKVLVVTQFVFSVGLIASMLIIGRQLDFIRSKNLGFDRENVFKFGLTENILKHREALLHSLAAEPGVRGVTSASANILQTGSNTGDTDWENKAPDAKMIVSPISIDRDFMSFFDMQLVQGVGFTGTKADSVSYILNEEAVEQTGLKDPIGKRFKLWQTEGIIVGVVRNFHFQSLREKIRPAVFHSRPDNNWLVYVKTTGSDASKAVAAARKMYNQYEQSYPFDYAFLDESFDKMYRSEQRTGQLFLAFAAIAVFISCLGLFGLSAFTVEKRIKEIGIRKVLGASVAGITGLLAKDFMKLVGMAILIASPIAWYVMSNWLENFAYRIDIQWWVFALAAVAAIGVAFLTVGFQSLRAALANPVKSLRSE